MREDRTDNGSKWILLGKVWMLPWKFVGPWLRSTPYGMVCTQLAGKEMTKPLYPPNSATIKKIYTAPEAELFSSFFPFLLRAAGIT